MEYTETDAFIKALRSLRENELYIVGAGKYGEIFGSYFNKHGIDWVGYIDKRAGVLQQINGTMVYAYDDIDMNTACFMVSTYLYRKEVLEELKSRGVTDEQIYLYKDQRIFFEIYEDLIHCKELTKRMSHFYHKYDDQRCFIIGNGPSLRKEDLQKLKNSVSFASNSIYALYKSIDWRPTFYCAQDPIFCKEMMSNEESMQRVIQGCDAAFIALLGEGIQFREYPDMRHVYYMRTLDARSGNGKLKFSTDCCEQVYTAGTITYSMLQLAVYMGFKQIYLLGMDFSYSVEKHEDNSITRQNVCNHMEEIEREEKKLYKSLISRWGSSYLAEIDLQLAGYKTAKEYADAHDIEIYNATRGGKLEVFPRIDFDSLLH